MEDTSLSHASFWLSLISLCITCVIVSDQYRLRRDIKKNRDEDLKHILASIIKDVQEKNNTVWDRAHFAIEYNKIEEYKDELIKLHAKLVDSIETARITLLQYTHEDAKKLKVVIDSLKSFQCTKILVFINANHYDDILNETKSIENKCRPFSYVVHSMPPPIDRSK